MTNDDRHPLEPLSATDPPHLDAVTQDRIESGLRVQHAEKQLAPRRRGLPRWAVLAPLGALVLITTIALVLRDEAAVAALELRDARDVVVTLPDGEVILDPADGFALIDGAVVTVGAAGRATIDDVTLDPGAVVTVRDGRLVTDVVATTTTPRADEPADADPPTDASVPGITTTTARPTTTTPPDTTRPEAQSSDRPDAPPSSTTAPVDRPIDAVEPPGDTRSSPPPHDGSDAEIELALRVRRSDAGIAVAWNAEGADREGWRVVVVRTADGSEPLDATSGTVVGEGQRGEATERRDDLPAVVDRLRYRVIVVDNAGGVVARGPVQTLAPPGS